MRNFSITLSANMDADSNSSPRKDPYVLLLSFFAVLGIGFRFVALESVPPGVFVDEQAGMANALCLLRNGTSLYGDRWPLYFQALGGFYDPIFIYSQALIIKLLGPSIAAFRVFPALCLLSACFGTAALARTILGRDAALLALVTSLFCPWSFHAGRLVWGSGLITAFIPWGLFFLLRTRTLEEKAGAAYRSAVVGGLCLAAAASLYRPANAVVLLLLALLFVFRFRPMNVRFRYLFTAVGVLVVCGIPNIMFLMGRGWNRVDTLSIFGTEHMAKLDGSRAAAMREMLENFGKLLSWDFLFVSGDAIYRHTPATGALGWPELLGFAALASFLLRDAVRRRATRLFNQPELVFVAFCFCAVLIGLFPAAQSWDSNPHALRANGAWPFFVLLAVVGLTKLYRHLSLAPLAVSLFFSVSIPLFLSYYFLTFPTRGEPWFDTALARTAREAKTTGNWEDFGAAVKEYGKDGPSIYPMMYLGLDCMPAIELVESLKAPKSRRPRVTIDFAKPAPLSLGEQSTSPVPAP